MCWCMCPYSDEFRQEEFVFNLDLVTSMKYGRFITQITLVSDDICGENRAQRMQSQNNKPVETEPHPAAHFVLGQC